LKKAGKFMFASLFFCGKIGIIATNFYFQTLSTENSFTFLVQKIVHSQKHLQFENDYSLPEGKLKN